MEIADGTESFSFKGHGTGVVSVQFHPDGREILSSVSQHRTSEPFWRRWSLKDRKEISSLKAGTEESFGCAAISPDGKRVLVGGPGGFLKFLSW